MLNLMMAKGTLGGALTGARDAFAQIDAKVDVVPCGASNVTARAREQPAVGVQRGRFPHRASIGDLSSPKTSQMQGRGRRMMRAPLSRAHFWLKGKAR